MRLAQIHTKLMELIQRTHPNEAAVEETFVNMNPKSTLKLGMARGVVLMTPAYLGIETFEYAANTIKKSVVGVGHADKTQVAHMVQRLLPRAGTVSKDAADALAVAICHSHHRHVHSLSSPGLRSAR